MKISVVIPTFNKSRYIERCLESIIDQTLSPDEIIIVDDCSSDNTIEVINNYLRRTSCNIVRVIQLTTNMGGQYARNIGIKNAKNEWVAFMDSDDEWLPEKLSLQVMAIEETGYEVCASGCNVVEYEKEEKWLCNGKSGYVYSDVLALNEYLMFQSLLVKKSILEKIGYLDELVPAYQELDTALAISKIANISYVNEPLFRYYIVKDSIFRKRKRSIAGRKYVYNKWKSEIKRYGGKEALKNWYGAFYNEYPYYSLKRYMYALGYCILQTFFC